MESDYTDAWFRRWRWRRRPPAGAKAVCLSLFVALACCGDPAETPVNPTTALEESGPSGPLLVAEKLVPTLWGDDSTIKVNPAFTGGDRPGDSDGSCIRISYLPGEKHWGAVYWQARREGGIRTPVKLPPTSKISFWARGEAGSELVDFRVLGDPARELLSSRERTRLPQEWKHYELSVAEPMAEETAVTAIFGVRWQSTGAENPAGLTFYLDDVRCE